MNMTNIWENVLGNLSGADVANCLKACKSLRAAVGQCLASNSRIREEMDVAATVSAIKSRRLHHTVQVQFKIRKIHDEEHVMYGPEPKDAFCDIDNIHKVTSTFNKMSDIMQDPANFKSIQTYGPAVEQTGYMQLISTILKSVNSMLDCLLKQKRNILVHCSDGWDRTAQLSALTQLRVDPFDRTIRCFLVLCKKGGLGFGHQFQNPLLLQVECANGAFNLTQTLLLLGH